MPKSRYLIGSLPYYSVLIVLGMALAILLASKEADRRGLPKDTITDLALLLIPCAVIGARIYYVVFAWETFRSHPLSIFAVWEGGLAIYGGILAGMLAVLLFAQKKKVPARTLLDCIVPGLALAQAIGRWGNFFNMEAYGVQVTHPSLQFFPMAVMIPEASGNVWHLATFFYESVWDALIFLFLWSIRKRASSPGALFGVYALLYASGRLVIEGLRTDSLMWGTMRVSQLLAFSVCLLYTLLILRFYMPSSRPSPGAIVCTIITLATQSCLFLVLPIASLEAGYAPWLFLMLGTMLSLIFLCPDHLQEKRLIACILLVAWVAYVFIRSSPDLFFCLLFSMLSITGGLTLGLPMLTAHKE
ncbi:MAG: prolipoprotein diacylglyceryl transferase [Clostridia bacterium]|nr:prolipoprotein diacylglyceryl transferase [Clostridia bacterium]